MPSPISRIFTSVVESYIHNKLSIKYLLITTGNFWNYCGHSCAGLCIFKKKWYRVYQKTYSENFVDYFPPGKNGMIRSVSTQKLFHIIVVHSKPIIKKWYLPLSICCKESGFKST